MGLEGDVGFVVVPVGYVSGTPLASTATWAGTTIAAMGLTPGTYAYTWASDAFNVHIGAAPPPPAAAPAPALSVWALLVLAASVVSVGAFLSRRSRLL